MFRIHFTADDLVRTRIVASYGPYAEALFCLGVLHDRRRAGALFGGWRQQVADPHQSWARHLGAVVGRHPRLDLFTLIGRVATAEEGTQAMLGIGRRHLEAEMQAASQWAAVGAPGAARLPAWANHLHDDRETRSAFAAALRACCAATVDPHWDPIQAHLEAEAALRARVVAQGGTTAQLLGSLHPGMDWRDGALRVQETSHTTGPVATQMFPHDDGVSVGVSDVHLNGRGLTLVPSVFCRRITPYVSVADRDGPVVLFYPALRDVTDAHRLWARRHPGSTHRSLVALLGTTRAAALDALTHPCTTSELARHLHVSPATASYHAAVLREAGLSTTRRHGSAVLHVISPLGSALLNGGQRPHDAAVAPT